MPNHLTNNYADYLLENGIVYVTYKKGVHINVEAAMQIVKDRLQIQNGESYPVLCDARQIDYADKPARDYLAIEGSILINALAYVVNKPYMEMVTEFYVQTTKPVVVLQKTFLEISEALSFLKKFKT
tara:strand:+ start:5727 stop:6107 length:381 start_codon:yes stop_codon:yes gene_type:complete